MIEALKIIAFSTFAAIAYGILHDQVTAHVCVEYFTIAHPPVFPTQSPFWLAVGWGVIATWWVGLPLGIGLAAAARLGSMPRLGLAELRRSVVTLMIASAILAFLAGGAAAALVATGVLAFPDWWADVIAPQKRIAFSFDMWAHSVSYAVGAAGGLLAVLRTVIRRKRLARAAQAASFSTHSG